MKPYRSILLLVPLMGLIVFVGTACSIGHRSLLSVEDSSRRVVRDWSSGTHTMTVGGLERTFLLDVPSDLKPGAALVLGFHGYTGSAEGFRSDAGFTPLTEKHGFVAVYPQGTRDSRGNSFHNVGYAFHEDSEVDDVQFVTALVARLVSDLKLDPEAVFSTGMSNGGDMSFYLATRPDPIVRTIAPVAGTMMVKGHEAFVPQKRLSVLEVHGTDDGITKWNGDLENRDGWGAYYGIDQVLQFWVDGFALEQKATVSISGISDDRKQVNRHRWWTAADDTEVIFYEVLKGKHTWPDNLGDENVSTAEAIWQFFDRHR
jgi:polyhydroxybutyrate depolymerase